jgi:VWFA-related protein
MKNVITLWKWLSAIFGKCFRVAQIFSQAADDHLIAASFFKWLDVMFQSTKVSELQKGIKLKVREDADCSTMIYDVVDDALKRMSKVQGRKAIVLFSDGIGTGTFYTAKSNLHKAEEQDALIYTVQFGTFPDAPHPHVSRKAYFQQVSEVNGYMRGLAQKTGGRYYQVENISDLETTFRQVAEDLGQQYSLGYYPKTTLKAGQRRQIKVEVGLPNVVVRRATATSLNCLRKSNVADKARPRSSLHAALP